MHCAFFRVELLPIDFFDAATLPDIRAGEAVLMSLPQGVIKDMGFVCCGDVWGLRIGPLAVGVVIAECQLSADLGKYKIMKDSEINYFSEPHSGSRQRYGVRVLRICVHADR